MTTQLSRRSLLRRLGAGATMSLGIAPLARAASAERETSEPTVDVGDKTAGPVRLHKNESAFGPSAAVVAAIRAASASVVTRYPETADAMLRRKLADLHRVSPDQIVLGCGSDDVLGMAIAAFGAGRKVVVADPTYDAFVDCARRNGADVNAVPLRGDYTHDLEAMLTRADASTALVYVCNPNNPTGSLTRRRDLEAFIAKLPPSSYILMDEAYHHYVGGSSDYASFIDRPVNDPRVIVTRSFSTVHGLGGLRVGYAVASLDAAARMR